MQHRSPKQCRERYHQNLKPSLNHEPISNDEGELIEQLVQEIGKRWAEIARRLGNRSDNAVKNWWNGSMNRRRRNTPHGVSRVGPRQMPISAAVPPQPLSTNSLHSHHHTHHLPLQSQPPAHEGLRLFKGVNGSSPPSHSSAMVKPSYTPQSAVGCAPKPPKLELHSRPRASSSLPSPNPLDLTTCPSLLRHLQAPYPGATTRPTGGEQRPDWPLPRIVDLPAISPATTEFSSTGSARRPPSLVSDNLSHYSISPKTISSPPLGMYNSMARMGQNCCAEDLRSGYSVHGHGKGIKCEGDESGYASSVFNESGSDDFALHPAPRRHGHDSHSARRMDENRAPRGSSVEKDSRMSVSRLLD
ncbi:hypothetical protein DV738_g198, partial [Chaetothyriales sp. CBS 135597]